MLKNFVLTSFFSFVILKEKRTFYPERGGRMKKRSYCTDALSVFLLALFWIFLLLGGLLRLWAMLLLSIPFGVLTALRFFMDGAQRKRENALFLHIVTAPIRWIRNRKYVFVDCPQCGARMRFSKEKRGKYRVLCPRCGAVLSLTLDGRTAKIENSEGGQEQ